MGTKKHMKQKLSQAGDQMMQALSLDANITSIMPLESQLGGLQMVIAFMNSILVTIVAFLAILCC